MQLPYHATLHVKDSAEKSLVIGVWKSLEDNFCFLESNM